MKFELIPITNIYVENYSGKVYDITVENKSSYNINGISVHNSVCETKTETGVYMPMITAIQECIKGREDIITSQYISENQKPPHQRQSPKKLPLIIADGGIKTPSDMCKALALGADLVMCGGIFAGTEEAPGNVINDGGKLVKLYRGAASFGVQLEKNDTEPDYVEGRETFVQYKGKVHKVIKRFKNGLASSMSYMNARCLDEYRKNVSYITIN